MEHATVCRADAGQARAAQKAICDGVAAKQNAVRPVAAGQKAEVARFCGRQWGVLTARQRGARRVPPPSVVRRAAPAPSPDVLTAPGEAVLAMAMHSVALGHDNDEMYRRRAKLWVYQLAPPSVVEANC